MPRTSSLDRPTSERASSRGDSERIAIDRGTGVGWNTLCDICGLLPLVLKGRVTPLTEDDIPSHTPLTFSLVSDDASAVANQIDSLSAALRAVPHKLPLALRIVLKERRALVVVGSLFGIVHGVINSLGRFILLRASINAVVNEASFETRISLAFGVVAVIVFEGILLLCVKHFFADHIAHYAGGRMSTMVLRKVARVGARPAGTEETSFIGADLPQLVELTRIVAFLPSGVVSLGCGLAVLLVFLGWSGLVGLIVLYLIFSTNLKLADAAKGADRAGQEKMKARLRTMKQVVDGVKAIKYYAWEESYLAKVGAARVSEVLAIKNYKQLQIVSIILGRAGPILATASVFITRTAEGRTLSTAEAFATLAVFQTLRVGMIFLPLSITLLGVLFSNVRRTEAYLNVPEPEQAAVATAARRKLNGGPDEGGGGGGEVPLVELRNCQAVWDGASNKIDASHAGGELLPLHYVKVAGGGLRQRGSKQLKEGEAEEGGRAMTAAPTGEDAVDEEDDDEEAAAEGAVLASDLGLPAGIDSQWGLFSDDPLGFLEEDTPHHHHHLQAVDVEQAQAGFDWSSGGGSVGSSFTLDVPSLQVFPGSIVAVVGQVGSGKSMLLDTLLGGGPTVLEGGRALGTSSLGLVPQESMVVSGTVKENVLLGRPFDRSRFEWAVESACMRSDLELLGGHREDTVVGEKGTTLSGGQQQRLNIARALYGLPELLVCDDPLAAVDAVVGGNIFHALKAYVKGQTEESRTEETSNDNAKAAPPLPQGKGGKNDEAAAKHRRRAVLVVLNQLHLLPECDSVVFMHQGKALASGTYAHLLEACPPFATYVSSYQNQANSTADDAEGGEEGEQEAEKEGASGASGGGGGGGGGDQPAGETSAVGGDRVGAAAAGTAGAQTKNMKSTKDAPLKEASLTEEKEEAAAATPRPLPSQVVTKETTVKGVVQFGVLLRYLRSGGWGGNAACFVLLLFSFASLGLNDLWLARWTSKVDSGDVDGGSWFYCGVYCALSFSYIFFNLLSCLGFVLVCSTASQNVHGDCLSSLLAAPLSWFESMPSGRILSRFSADMMIMDIQFGLYFDGFYQMGLSSILVLAIVSMTNLYLLALCVVAGYAIMFSVSTIFMSMREIKRIANTALSPVVTNVAEAVRGRLLGRVLGCSDFFVNRHLDTCNTYLTASYTASTLMQFNALATQAVALTISVTVCMYAILDKTADKDTAGLLLTYAFLLPYFLSLFSDMTMLFFSMLPALERLFEYLPGEGGTLPTEPARVAPGDAALLAAGWPRTGSLSFRGVDMKYRPDLPNALNNLSVEIKSGEKIGVVGRTGAGKSTLFSVLFRLTEISAGSVLVDGHDISKLGLKTLRSSLAMIPQEAVLIEGTVRENLDPFDTLKGETGTKQLESVLSKVGLTASMLDQDVGTGGDNLSVGERQLLAIARVLLRASSPDQATSPNESRMSRIFVMDEPTAHIDPATDATLQRVIRTEFEGATLVTIAHRLHTVADFDKIVVMDRGRLLEMGPPLQLLDRGPERSAFASMVQALGEDAAAAIREKAMSSAPPTN